MNAHLPLEAAAAKWPENLPPIRKRYEALIAHYMPEGWAMVTERMAAGDHITFPAREARGWAVALASVACCRGETPETLIAGKPVGVTARKALAAIEQEKT